jgi:hypothetical protein
VRDTERNVAHSYVLGELATVFAKDVIVGSDPSCDVIFDDPSVPAFAAEFSGKGHHMYARSLPDGEPDRSGRAVPVGPFAVGIAFTSTPHDHAASTPNLRLRFGPRCRLDHGGRALQPVIALHGTGRQNRGGDVTSSASASWTVLPGDQALYAASIVAASRRRDE